MVYLLFRLYRIGSLLLLCVDLGVYAVQEASENVLGGFHSLDVIRPVYVKEGVKFGGRRRVGEGARDGDRAVEAEEGR